MKSLFRTCIITIFLLSIQVQSNAQNKSKSANSNTIITARGFLGIANVTDLDNSIGPKLSYGLGASFQFNISGSFAVQPEFLYQSLGAESKDSPPYLFNFGYITIPILAKLSIGNDGQSLFTGPAIGMNIGSKVERNGVSVEATGVKSNDLQWVFGADYRISKIIIDARYGLSLSSITETGTLKNTYIHLGLGYILN